MEENRKTEPITVDVTPKYFHLPTHSCQLTVNCDPSETKQTQYQYSITLTHRIRKDDTISHDDHVLPLSLFKSITPGVYDYEVKVTSNDLCSEGYASGSIRIYPGNTLYLCYFITHVCR